jgi:hypothetical protein
MPPKNMTRLEDLQPTTAVRGILPHQVVTVVSVQWFGSEALELTYKGPFLALLEGDRFEGRFRDGVHQVEVADLMRHMVKRA